MILYSFPNTCALASHLALEYAGVEYEVRHIKVRSDGKKPEDLLAVNPLGRVPALVTDNGVLTETPAILAYIAQTHPEAELAPVDDPWLFARLQAFNSYLASTVHVAHAHKYRGYRWADNPPSFEDMKQKVPHTMTACFELIEHELLTGPWVLGDMFSVSDLYLFTLAMWLEGDGADTSLLPRVLAHRQQVADLPITRRVLDQVGAMA